MSSSHTDKTPGGRGYKRGYREAKPAPIFVVTRQYMLCLRYADMDGQIIIGPFKSFLAALKWFNKTFPDRKGLTREVYTLHNPL